MFNDIRSCRGCGKEFTATHNNHRYCATCREARFNAMHPLKTCRACGQESRDMGRNASYCGACRRESVRATSGDRDDELTRDELWKHVLIKLAMSPPDLQLEILAIVRKHFGERAAATPDPDDARQRHCDDVARGLLEDLDI